VILTDTHHLKLHIKLHYRIVSYLGLDLLLFIHISLCVDGVSSLMLELNSCLLPSEAVDLRMLSQGDYVSQSGVVSASALCLADISLRT